MQCCLPMLTIMLYTFIPVRILVNQIVPFHHTARHFQGCTLQNIIKWWNISSRRGWGRKFSWKMPPPLLALPLLLMLSVLCSTEYSEIIARLVIKDPRVTFSDPCSKTPEQKRREKPWYWKSHKTERQFWYENGFI